LVALGEHHGVPREDAEELANDTLLAVIEKFDPARGRADTFARTVMMNKVRNFARDHKLPPAVPFDDEQYAGSPTPEDVVIRKEDKAMIRQTRARLLTALTDEEARFLLEYEVVLDDLDDRAVSETARRLDLTAQEGHNIRQRIERKARKIAASVSGEAGPLIRAVVKREPEPVETDAMTYFEVSGKAQMLFSRMPNADFDLVPEIATVGLNGSDRSLGRFLGALDPSRRDRLLSFLS
jgi:DNA-directed RNA polymerase specialized sigma24 family protein